LLLLKLVLPVRLERRQRQRVRAVEAASKDVVWGRDLLNCSAEAAGELLPALLHCLPRDWHQLLRIGDVLTAQDRRVAKIRLSAK
jgi:hypothetical protein